jgi:AcrR family transcriptional regulator
MSDLNATQKAESRVGTRELNKQVRKRAILDAARALILEDKSKDFSMPALAERAGVSLVTPYNLFGSKSNILLEIVREDIFERAGEIDGIGTLELAQWISDLSAVLARVYYRKRHFYRRMIVTLVAQESAVGQRAMLDLTYDMFEPAIARLQRQGSLVMTPTARAIARHLAHSVSGSLQHRLMERGSEEGLRNEIECGVILTLAGLCEDADRALLRQRLEALALIAP